MLHNLKPHSEELFSLEVKELKKYYPIKKNFFNLAKVNKNPQMVKALNGVSFFLKAGETIAVVGESGCGKSTLAKQISLLERPTSGDIIIQGKNTVGLSKKEIQQFRTQVQMVFQNPYASLNPRATIGKQLEEPLRINTDLTAKERKEKVLELMGLVGLIPEYYDRFPHMFSGGQRQRMAIARAMILNPKIVIADEPTSALDVSIQAQVLNLFLDLQDQFKTSYLFISHNLSVVEHIADRVIVMYLGKIVEFGSKKAIYQSPMHPYTQVLLSSSPSVYAKDRKNKIKVTGELPSPLDIPLGCAFNQRCPYATDECRSLVPELRSIEGTYVACHHAEKIK
ncbi:dipeptide ABC transporter ATP-binding protein [Thorsellia kenyensis]|uniref:Dipeptide ABC transporter ATP-binding protein n=1 Tax=Thorsellia kenyensis TaxID=1549888 RepID=A0ABV6CDD8_9GAMM